MKSTHAAQILIRPAYADDYRALQRLAALDSADAIPPRPLLLAEVDGTLRAALSLRDGRSIADPFFATAALLTLLRAHAAGGPPASARSHPWWRRRPTLSRPRLAHG